MPFLIEQLFGISSRNLDTHFGGIHFEYDSSVKWHSRNRVVSRIPGKIVISEIYQFHDNEWTFSIVLLI